MVKFTRAFINVLSRYNFHGYNQPGMHLLGRMAVPIENNSKFLDINDYIVTILCFQSISSPNRVFGFLHLP
jgi:hypothetical protein